MGSFWLNDYRASGEVVARVCGEEASITPESLLFLVGELSEVEVLRTSSSDAIRMTMSGLGGVLGWYGDGGVGDRLQFLHGERRAKYTREGAVLWAAAGIDRAV